MTDKQPEALRLASMIERYNNGVHSQALVDDYSKAADELRRLHEVNAELVEALKIAEAALSDIGDADREPEDDLAWCEARAAEAIPKTRAALAKATGENND